MKIIVTATAIILFASCVQSPNYKRTFSTGSIYPSHTYKPHQNIDSLKKVMVRDFIEDVAEARSENCNASLDYIEFRRETWNNSYFNDCAESSMDGPPCDINDFTKLLEVGFKNEPRDSCNSSTNKDQIRISLYFVY